MSELERQLRLLQQLSPDERKQLPYNHPLLDSVADLYTEQYRLPRGLLRAIKNHGERSQAYDVSPKGARGVLQLMPRTAAELGVKDPEDPLDALQGAAKYLRNIQRHLKTNDPLLLAAAYNAGPFREDVRAGRVPPIEETQNYVTRIAQALEIPMADKREKVEPARRADLPDWKRKGQRADPEIPSNPAYDPRLDPTWAPDPASTFSETLELGLPWAERRLDTGIPVGAGFNRFMAGFGKKALDTKRGALQLLGHTPQSEVDEVAMRDLPLMNRGEAQLGYGLGALLEMLYGGRLLRAAPGAAGAGPAMREIGSAVRTNLPNVARIATAPSVRAATGAATYGATQPVTTDQSRLGQMALNALLAGTTQAGMSAAQRAMSPVKELASPTVESLVRTAERFKIPLRSEQVSDSPATAWLYKVFGNLPLSGKEAMEKKQAEQFSRAVSQTFGQNTPNINEAITAGRRDLGKVYRDISARNTIYLTQGDRAALEAAKKNPYLSEAEQKQIGSIVDDVLERYKANNGALPGEVYQDLRSKLKKARIGANVSGNFRETITEVKDALDRAMRRSITNLDDYELWNKTDRLYSNLKTVERVAPAADSDGLLSPRALTRSMSSTAPRNAHNRQALMSGVAPPERLDLAQLTKIGDNYLKAAGVTPSEGSRLAHMALTPAGLFAALYGIGEATHSEHPIRDALMGTTGAIAGGMTAGRMLNSPYSVRGFERLPFIGQPVADVVRGAQIAGVQRIPVAASTAKQTTVPPVGQPGPSNARDLGEPVPAEDLPVGAAEVQSVPEEDL